MNEPKPQFFLTEHEKKNPVWIKLVEHWNERLLSLRKQNDSEKPEASTAKLRGQIAEVKAMLELNNEPKILEAPPL